MSDFLTRLADLFGASRYLAHSLCLSNDPVLVPLFVTADGVIGLSYYLIAFALWFSVSQKARIIKLALIILHDKTIIRLFFLFILFCGVTHHTMVLTLWFGVYYLDVLARLATAIVSLSAGLQIAAILLRSRDDGEALDAFSGETATYPGCPLPLPNPAVTRISQRGADASASQAE